MAPQQRQPTHLPNSAQTPASPSSSDTTGRYPSDRASPMSTTTAGISPGLGGTCPVRPAVPVARADRVDHVQYRDRPPGPEDQRTGVPRSPRDEQPGHHVVDVDEVAPLAPSPYT